MLLPYIMVDLSCKSYGMVREIRLPTGSRLNATA